jgi:uridine phosphorylase
MLKKQKFPILEFDPDRKPIINAKEQYPRILGMPERCVFCFFPTAIKKFLKNHPDYEIVSYFVASNGFIRVPVYKVKIGNDYICLMQAVIGGPAAVAQIDEMVAHGCTKFLVIGSAGVIDKEHQYGKLMLPVAAIRDEGASYHYVEPSREIEVDKRVVTVIEKYLLENNIPFIKGKTWTTDAFYRETKGKIGLRESEECISAEMECASYLAAAQYNRVKFGQILYAGDCVGGEFWHNKRYKTKTMRDRTEYELLEHAVNIIKRF